MKCKKGQIKVNGKCKLARSNKKNKPINVRNLWIVVVIAGTIILSILLFYGGSQGWFKSLSVIEDVDLINYIESPQNMKITSCSLSITPSSVNAGGMITGTIVDGRKAFCQVFAKRNNEPWVRVFGGYADANGLISDERVVNMQGSYSFRGICDTNENNRIDTEDCLTNFAGLIVS